MTLVVTDASPLIALVRIDRAALLPRLFDRVVAPRAVADEVGTLPAFVEVMDAPANVAADLRQILDPGESEAIALAEALGAVLLVDERKGRRVARSRGLTVRGTVGVLLLAYDHRLIATVRPELDALIAAGFHIGEALYADALRLAGELPMS